MAREREGPSSLRVLVVDDEPLIRWSLSETLAENGHSVTEAPDGDAALRTLTAAAPPVDVVVLDYNLPDSNDLTLLSKIRQVAPQAVVIMLTAWSTAETADAALQLGVYRVIAKPFEVQEIANLVLEAYASTRC
jgi:DNA-binding NtrC family response regulator